MQNINFYDPSLRLRHDWLSLRMASALCLAAAVPVVTAGAWLSYEAGRLRASTEKIEATTRDEQSAMQELTQKISNVRPNALLEQRFVAMQRTLEHHQAALQMLREGGIQRGGGHAQALQALARQSIDGLWLTAVALDRGDMALRGRSLRPELVPAYVERLRGEPALQGHTFRALDIRRPEAERGAAAAPAGEGFKPAAARAPFVEFSLTGSSNAAVSPTGTRP